MKQLSRTKNEKKPVKQMSKNSAETQWKLWIYTNYDCHLRCSYCVAESSPEVERRAIGIETVQQLVDEAIELGFCEIFFTGGEPFILDDIYEMLEYSAQHVHTTVLTTGMLLKRRRLERLKGISNGNLRLQVSLDGGRAEHHDAYRGTGTWTKTVESIKRLQENNFHVRISTTETPANTDHLHEICELHLSLGIREEDHFIRPLARRGFSSQGIEVSMATITPEITVNREGVFWHPLSTDEDMRVSKTVFPLSCAVKCVQEQLEIIAEGGTPRITFT
jgi:MoaA/NifB/PqqE/SkfB family radical SAM enzyme